MEHYPDIQRQQGTLFFIPDGDRQAIAISIERLIDLLDAMGDDPDAEDGGDFEPTHGWPNAGQPANAAMCLDDEREQDNSDSEPALGALERHPNALNWHDHSSQERWHVGADDDREDDGDDLEPSLLCQDYRNGRVEVDVEGDGSDDEYSHGWTGHIDQNVGLMNCSGQWTGEGEPDLGWSGHGTGWKEGDDPQSREADLLGDSECELDLAEHGVCDHEVDTCSVLTAAQAGLVFDGTGSEKAGKLLAGYAANAPYRPVAFIKPEAAMQMTAAELGAALVELGFAKAQPSGLRVSRYEPPLSP